MERNFKSEGTVDNSINGRIDAIYESLNKSNDALRVIKATLGKLVDYQYKRDQEPVSGCVDEYGGLIKEPTVVDRLNGIVNVNKDINNYLEELIEHLSQVL